MNLIELKKLYPNLKRVKLWVYAPRENVNEVREAMGQAGGGRIGNYTFCAFVTEGTGFFFSEEGASPAIGQLGRIESVPEAKIEIEADLDSVGKVVQAIHRVHPYEEVPIDIFPLFEIDWFQEN